MLYSIQNIFPFSSGKAIDVVLRDRGTGEKMIEDFMIAANEAVATTIYPELVLF